MGGGVVIGLTMPCQSVNSTQPGGKGGGVVTGLTMPCQSINTTQPGGGGRGDRSDNVLSVYQYHTGWRWGWGGVVIGLTLPCQSINRTQAGGGGGGGGSHRSDNALLVYQ